MKEQIGAGGGGVMMLWVFISKPLILQSSVFLKIFLLSSSTIPDLLFNKIENILSLNTRITTNTNLNECIIMHIFTQTSGTAL